MLGTSRSVQLSYRLTLKSCSKVFLNRPGGRKIYGGVDDNSVLGCIYLRDEPSLEDILGETALESLGEPDVRHPAKSAKGPANVELRTYSDPELTALTGMAYNLSSQVVPARTLDDETYDDEEIWNQALTNFQNIVREGPENPVFVSEEVLQFFDDNDLVPAALKFSDDETVPASLRPVEEYYDKVQGTDMFKEVDFDDYRQDVDYRALRNRVLTPTLVDPEGEPARNRKTAILYREAPEPALEGDTSLTEDILEPEEARRHADGKLNYHVVEQDGSYLLTAQPESGELDAWVEDGRLFLDYGEAVTHVEGVDGEIKELEENNGVYNIEVK